MGFIYHSVSLPANALKDSLDVTGVVSCGHLLKTVCCNLSKLGVLICFKPGNALLLGPCSQVS